MAEEFRRGLGTRELANCADHHGAHHQGMQHSDREKIQITAPVVKSNHCGGSQQQMLGVEGDAATEVEMRVVGGDEGFLAVHPDLVKNIAWSALDPDQSYQQLPQTQ